MCRAVRRLLLFVLPVECIAGLTLDAVCGELHTQDVADTTALTRPEPTHASPQSQDTQASRTIPPVVTLSPPSPHPLRREAPRPGCGQSRRAVSAAVSLASPASVGRQCREVRGASADRGCR
jgi:hypothetical protein